MTRRAPGKLETTIELCRSESKWQKVIELAEELRIGSPNYGSNKKINLIDYRHYRDYII